MGTRVFLYTKREKSIKIYGSHFSEKGTRIEIKFFFQKIKSLVCVPFLVRTLRTLKLLYIIILYFNNKNIDI